MVVELPQLQNVFMLSGVPQHTFVQPIEYPRLLVALRTPGRSIVVEGPSGIGKTTAVVKSVADAGLEDKVLSLSARKRSDVEFIEDLPNQLPIGTVVVDDFHRLSDDAKRSIADLMKTLADESAEHSKLIVLGITNAGQSLVVFGKDLANRIEVIQFEANPEHKIDELVSKGENALKVSINIKDEIVSAAQGSFYIAQMLAYNTCIRAGVLETQANVVTTEESYEAVKSHVMETLSRSFHDTAIAFARGTKLRREGRAPYLHLLYWASQSSSWSINALREADRHPEQRGSVTQVVTKGFLEELIYASEDIQRVIYFERLSGTLVIQDPQFVFYIRNLSWPRFVEEVGFVSLEFPSRYDFALSFSGADRDIAEGLFGYLRDAELEVFYDKNEQHRILAADVEEYLAPIYSSDAELVVCVLGPDYPRRIWTKFESEQFKQRFRYGEVVPVVLSSAPLGVFDTAMGIGHYAWDREGDFHNQVEEAGELLIKKSVEIRARRAREAEQARAVGVAGPRN